MTPSLKGNHFIPLQSFLHRVWGSWTMAQSQCISCISPIVHHLFSSIHPDYTSNGSSSQQPPTVMELCLNEQPCLCTSPLFSPVFFSHFSPFPCTEKWPRIKHTKAFNTIVVNVVGNKNKKAASLSKDRILSEDRREQTLQRLLAFIQCAQLSI